MAIPRESVASRLSRPYEVAVTEKFGVPPFESIPHKYRPPTTGDLSCPLLAKLSELALHVPDLRTFQQRLVSARERRQTNSPARWTDRCLQPRDVLLAIKELGEKAGGKPRAHSVIEGSQGWPLNGEKRPHIMLPQTPSDPDQAEFSRSTRSAAREKISEGPVQLKQSRNSSQEAAKASGPHKQSASPTSHGIKSMTYFDDNSLPVRREVREKDAEPSGPLLKPSPMPTRSSGQLKRQRHTTDIIPGRKTKRRSIRRNSPFEDNASMTPSRTVHEERRRKDALLKSLEERRLSLMQEHNYFFSLPPNQHFKKPKPTIIHDVNVVTDFDALKYPVEVPIPGRPGELWECETAEGLRELAEKVKRRSDLAKNRGSSSSYSDLSSPPAVEEAMKEDEDRSTMTPSVCDPASVLKALLDRQIQVLSDSMFSVSAAAVRAGGNLRNVEKNQVDQLRDTFVREIKMAQEKYEYGLKRIGILPSHESEEDNHQGMLNRDETSQSRLGQGREMDGDEVENADHQEQRSEGVDMSHIIDLGSDSEDE